MTARVKYVTYEEWGESLGSPRGGAYLWGFYDMIVEQRKEDRREKKKRIRQ